MKPTDRYTKFRGKASPLQKAGTYVYQVNVRTPPPGRLYLPPQLSSANFDNFESALFMKSVSMP